MVLVYVELDLSIVFWQPWFAQYVEVLFGGNIFKATKNRSFFFVIYCTLPQINAFVEFLASGWGHSLECWHFQVEPTVGNLLYPWAFSASKLSDFFWRFFLNIGHMHVNILCAIQFVFLSENEFETECIRFQTMPSEATCVYYRLLSVIQNILNRSKTVQLYPHMKMSSEWCNLFICFFRHFCL